MIKKIWNLEQMRKRIENLKKIMSPQLVHAYVEDEKDVADNELDALYLAFYNLKSLSLKYDRTIFGKLNEINYSAKEKFDWSKYLYEYSSTQFTSTSTVFMDYDNRITNW